MHVVHRLIAAALLLTGWAADATACSITKRGPFLTEVAQTSKACAHPLCGHIYATARPEAEDPKAPCPDDQWQRLDVAVTTALSSGGVVILGEMHDNATHHLLQAAAIREFALSAPQNKTAIVFEQLRDDQQPGIDKFTAKQRSAEKVTVADLKQAVDWQTSNWPDLYDPVFETVIAAKRPFYAGDVSRAEIMKAAKEGARAVPKDASKRFALDVPLGAKFNALSIKEIEDAHCGALPKEAFDGMAFAQRYRDAHLADAVLKAVQQNGSAILIAGTGHARTDRAVPWYIRKRAPEKKVLSVMFVEVENDNDDPETYVSRDPDGLPAADFLVFTQPAERADPCEKMRKK
ncbi:MAG: ChaN family lipoprotein [Proteobacteria bacterium]|nr:ChaN family lipoprotein [Pseudomonadota bacterium]